MSGYSKTYWAKIWQTNWSLEEWSTNETWCSWSLVQLETWNWTVRRFVLNWKNKASKLCTLAGLALVSLDRSWMSNWRKASQFQLSGPGFWCMRFLRLVKMTQNFLSVSLRTKLWTNCKTKVSNWAESWKCRYILLQNCSPLVRNVFAQHAALSGSSGFTPC